MGKSIIELQNIEAVAEFPWLEEFFGNILNISRDGELQVSCPLIEAENQVRGTYNEIKKLLEEKPVGCISTKGPLELTAKFIQGGVANFKGKTRVTLRGEEGFEVNRSLFGSEGNIELTSPTFKFIACFADVAAGQTTIKIIPHPNLDCPIEYLQIAPKKTPIFIQGAIDFKQLTFNDFIVSHSNILIKFKD